MTNRRDFIKYVTYAAGTLCLCDNGYSAFLFKDSATAERVEKEVASAITGKIVKSPLTLQEFTTDFGKTIRTEPALVVIPQNEADIKAVLKIANERGVPVSVRGAGHSCFGQTLSRGGIVLTRPSEKPAMKFEHGTITVDAHSSWLDLEKYLNQLGYTSPVLTDYLGLSIGGTLSVGGYGLRSFKYSGQIDNVDEFDLILTNGEKKTCSKEQNRQLFDYGLAGLGQLGLIRSVSFQPIEYKKYSEVFYLACPTVNDFIQGCKTVLFPPFVNKIDHFSAYTLGGVYIIEIASSFTENADRNTAELEKLIKENFRQYKKNSVSDYHLYAHQMREKWVNRYGSYYRMWGDYVLNIEKLEEFLHLTVENTAYKDSSILPTIYFLGGFLDPKPDSLPFTLAKPGEAALHFGIGFYYMVKIGDRKGKEKAQQQLMRNKDLVLGFGGRPYLCGCHYLSQEDKQALYGSDYTALKELKKQHDPQFILNPEAFFPPTNT